MLQCDRIQKNTSLEYKFNGRRKIPLTGLHLFEDVRRVLAEITVVPFLLFGSLLGKQLLLEKFLSCVFLRKK
jgi:hypothetical protein